MSKAGRDVPFQRSDDGMKFSPSDHAQKILANLNSLRKNSTFCDVEIVVGEKRFWAHKALLSASSVYFQAMFTSGLRESEKSEIELVGVSDGVISVLLDFIYTGHIELKKTNVQEIMTAADMYQLNDIKEACCVFLKKELHPSNCLGIYHFADLRDCQSLKSAAENFTHIHFQAVIKEDEFLETPLPTLRVFLGSEHLRVEQERQVFDAAMLWIFHDVVKRRRHVYQILQDIRLSLLPKPYLQTYCKTCPDLSLKIALTKLVEDYFAAAPRTESRSRGIRRILVIGGYNREVGKRWSDSRSLNSAAAFYVDSGQWAALRPMNVSRSGHGVALLNDSVYAVGGESNDSMIFSHGEVYNVAEDRWELLPSMNNPRTLVGVCALNGLIYAVGGWVGSNLGNTVECYDPDARKWAECDTMATPRCAAGVVSHEGVIFVVGGLSEMLMELSVVECYNPVAESWRRLADMKVKRAYVGVAVVRGCLYVVGGVSGLEGAMSEVERYWIDEDRWESVPPMNCARGSPCVAAVNGCVYVMGGRTSSDEFTPANTIEMIECYDPQENVWKEVGKMPVSCCEAGVVVL